MRTAPLLRGAAAVVAAFLAFTVLGAQPAFAAPKPRLPLTITSQPAAQTTDTSATFAWSSTVADATYTCSLDGAAATTCSSPVTYTGLTDGTHTFVLTGKKQGSGYRPNTRSVSWTVDSVLPSAPTVTPVPSPTSSTSASITFTNADPSAVSHTCSLDGAAESTCTSPYAVSALGEGSHTVAVRAVDSSGNKSAPAQVTWTVDLTAPANVQVTGPASPTNSTTAQASFSAAGATSYSCSLDGGAAVACTSPHTMTGLSEGPHSLTVNASDAAGNVAQPGTVVWDVDTIAPGTPSILTGPAALTNQTEADFVAGEVDDSGTLQCRLDDPSGSWTTCPTPLSYTVAAGTHTLELRSHDVAGNSSGVVSATWVVDTTAPSPAAFTYGPATPSNDTTPDFAWVATDGSTNGFQCALDGGSYATCDVGAWPYPALTEGPHVLAVISLDDASNWSSAVSWTWEVDTTAPAAPVFSTSPVASTTDTSALFSFASEPGASFTCSLDGAAATHCASPVTLTGLAVGSHSFVVVAEDAAHNTNQASYGWTVTTSGGGGGSTPPPGGGTPTPPAPPAPAAPAPTAAIVTSSALRGTSTVTFSGDVSGVSTSTVVLADNSGAAAALTLVCKNAAGSVVDCATSAVRSVSAKPKAALVPGATYALSVTGGVTGAGGAAVNPVSATFRASTKEQENSLRAGFTWSTARSGSAYGRSYLVESHRGATFKVSFRGPQVTWYTATGPARGKATVLVDGKAKGTVDNYSAANRWRVARTLKGLGKGTHTLTVVVTGKKRAASAGTSVVVDAVKVGTKLSTSPAGKATWRRAPSKVASGRAYAVANAAGASTSFTFRGTAVSWSTQLAPTMGKARVYVDGVRKATVDNYSAKSRWNVLRTISGLSDAKHTVKIVVLGTKRKAARGTDVVVDRWIVR